MTERYITEEKLNLVLMKIEQGTQPVREILEELLAELGVIKAPEEPTGDVIAIASDGEIWSRDEDGTWTDEYYSGITWAQLIEEHGVPRLYREVEQ